MPASSFNDPTRVKTTTASKEIELSSTPIVLQFLTIVALFCLTATGAFGQWCNPWTPKGSLACARDEAAAAAGRAFGEAVATMRQARERSAEDLSARIRQARGRFLRVSPSDPGRKQAWDDLETLLVEKDFWYLAQEEPAMVQGILNTALLGKSNVVVDGGISEFARGLMNAWEEVLVFKTRRQPRKVSLEHALEESRPAYEHYRLARNWAEFAAEGRNLTDNPDDYLMYLTAMVRPWGMGTLSRNAEANLLDRATAYRQALIDVFGKDAVTSATKRLMNAPRNKGAMLSPALRLNGAEWTHPYLAFQALLGDGNPRSFLITLIASTAPKWDATAALTVYNRWVAAYGEKAILEAAERVRIAPKKMNRDALELTAAQDFGVRIRTVPTTSWSTDLYAAFEDLLSGKGEPRSALRAIIAFHDKLDSATSLDAAYGKFVAGHGGEQAVASALAKISALWTTPINLQSQEERELRGSLYGALDPGDYYVPLTGILSNSWTVTNASSPDVVDNPLYVAWVKYPPGTAVTYATRELTGRKDDDSRGVLFSTRLLKSADKDSVVVETGEKRFYLNSPSHGGSTRSVTFPARLNKSLIQDPDVPSPFKKAESGRETLELGGRNYACDRQRWIADTSDTSTIRSETLTIWSSDEVPGGLVRRLLEHKEVYRRDPRIASGYTVEMVLQPTPIKNLDTQTQVPGATFGATNEQTVRNAKSTTVSPEQTGASSLPLSSGIPNGLQLWVTTTDAIDISGVNAGRSFRGQVDRTVEVGGRVIIPQGTQVFLKVRNLGSGGSANFVHLAISIDHAVINGQNVALVTTEATQTLGTTTLRGLAGPTVRNLPRVNIGAVAPRIAPQARMAFTVIAPPR